MFTRILVTGSALIAAALLSGCATDTVGSTLSDTGSVITTAVHTTGDIVSDASDTIAGNRPLHQSQQASPPMRGSVDDTSTPDAGKK